MISVLVAAGILAAAPAGPLWPIEIHSLAKVVRQEAARLGQPQTEVKEFVGGRKTLRADVNGDRRDELVVLFTLERGNFWAQYLTVLSSAGSPLATTEVSRKGVRAVDLDRTAGPIIQLTTKSYGPEDAMCCPSLPGHASYLIRGRHLREIKPPTAAVSRGTPPLVRRAHARHH